MSHRYCNSSQVSPKGGGTSSIKDSEKSVVMFSLVSGAPRSCGWRLCAISPSGKVRSDSFSTPLRPPRSTAFSPEFINPATRRSKFRSTTFRTYLNLGLRQLCDDFDLHEKARVDQALHLRPGGRWQPFLVVV